MAGLLLILCDFHHEHLCSNLPLRRLIEQQFGKFGGAELVIRNLVSNPLPHLSLASLPSDHPAAKNVSAASRLIAARERTAGEHARQEFENAAVMIISVSPVNLGVPSQLLAWVDHLCIPKIDHSAPCKSFPVITPKRLIFTLSEGTMRDATLRQAAREHVKGYLLLAFRNVCSVECVDLSP